MNPPAFLPPDHSPPALRTVGSTIADKYVLLEAIGTGSMGSVYRARHTALERDVALKLMAPEVAHDKSFTARFRREAHAASRLTHPSSVMITDFGEEPDGLLYLVMEYVRGPSLETMLERGDAFPEKRIVDILSQVLSAVAVAHSAGIVHRDLKPANVLVVETTDDDGRPVDVVKVCDFGVAALRDRNDLVTTGRYAPLRPSVEGGRQLTMAGAVVGTPAYMSPEQASGAPQDARTDVYSLGVVLFELLTGRLPLWGETLEDTMRAQIDTPAPSPRQFVDCTPALADVCLRAMAKRPADRFESARAMRAALRAAIATADAAPASAPPEATESLAGVAAVHELEPVPQRRSRARYGWAAALMAAGAVISFTWLSRGRPYEAEAQQIVHTAGALLPGPQVNVEPPGTPERAPLTVAAAPAEPPAVVAVEPAPARVPARKPKTRDRAPDPAPHGEPTAEPVAAAEPEAAAPAAAGGEAAPSAAEESTAGDGEKAWATRH